MILPDDAGRQLETPTGALIVNVLKSTPALAEIDIVTINPRDVAQRVYEKTSRLWRGDHSERTESEVFNSVWLGTMGELAIAMALHNYAKVELNAEEETKTYSYDLTVNEKRIEVKVLSELGARRFFSFSDERIAKNLSHTWNQVDLVIGMVKRSSDPLVLAPWVVIDSIAFDSNFNYWRRSRENSGRYLTMDLCQRDGLLAYV